jgi:hypothetical protein
VSAGGPSQDEIRLRKRNARDVRTLALLIFTSACYLAALILIPFMPTFEQVEGIVGVVLGLYVCAHPARHFMDLLLYRKIEGERFSSTGAMAGWLSLNALVMLGGWLVIVLGVMRLTAGLR